MFGLKELFGPEELSFCLGDEYEINNQKEKLKYMYLKNLSSEIIHIICNCCNVNRNVKNIKHLYEQHLNKNCENKCEIDKIYFNINRGEISNDIYIIKFKNLYMECDYDYHNDNYIALLKTSNLNIYTLDEYLEIEDFDKNLFLKNYFGYQYILLFDKSINLKYKNIYINNIPFDKLPSELNYANKETISEMQKPSKKRKSMIY